MTQWPISPSHKAVGKRSLSLLNEDCATVGQRPQSSYASRLTVANVTRGKAFRGRDFPTRLHLIGSDYVEIKRFAPDPTRVVGDLDCYSMLTSVKFSIFDGYTRRSWPCMREYSSRDVNSQASISDTRLLTAILALAPA